MAKAYPSSENKETVVSNAVPEQVQGVSH